MLTARTGPVPAAALQWRQVVASTNIAETSVTIEGIVYVVDAGFVKVARLLVPLARLLVPLARLFVP